MTAFGAYINEASLANQEVFDEIKARCSGPGARIVADTNPDHPEHWLLKDYIQSKAPKGMFYDRGIGGLWVSGEGVVYPEFDRNVHVITREQANKLIFDRYFAGVDWGWEHYGAIVVIGAKGDEYYIIEEYAAQHKYIGEWIKRAKDVIRRYGNIPFYCDPARTEHISAFQKAGISAYLANNRVLSGIEAVATLMTTKKFFIVYNECPRFREEIYKYVWKKNTGEPLKENDDVLCAIRYGIYSDMTVGEIETPQKQIQKAKRLRGML